MYGVASEAIEGLGAAQLCSGGSTKQYRFYRETHSAHFRCANERAWSNETRRVEDAHSAGMA